MKSKERIIWIDFIKILACVMVVALHSISSGVKNGIYKPGLWLYYLGTFAIPLFLMVTGYLQLKKDSVNFRYILKKIISVLIIVLVWTVSIFLVKKILHTESKSFLTETVGSLFQKGSFSHFWYLGSLIMIYIMLPVLQKMYKSKFFKYYIAIFIVLNIVSDVLIIYFYNKYGFVFKNNIIQTFRIWIWVLYFLIGGFINKINNKIMLLSEKKLIVLTIICIALTLLYEIKLSNMLYGNMYAESFYSSPLVIITSILIFVTISKFRFKNIAISKISSLTMGVYIIHLLVLSIINRIMPFNNNYFLVLNFLITFIVSLLLSFVISKIPKLNSLIKI